MLFISIQVFTIRHSNSCAPAAHERGALRTSGGRSELRDLHTSCAKQGALRTSRARSKLRTSRARATHERGALTSRRAPSCAKLRLAAHECSAQRTGGTHTTAHELRHAADEGAH